MEGAPHTAGRDQQINLCVFGVPPTPVYKGARGEEAAGQGGRAKGGVLLPPGVGLPSFLVGIGEGGEEEEEGKERGGAAPLPLSYSD